MRMRGGTATSSRIRHAGRTDDQEAVLSVVLVYSTAVIAVGTFTPVETLITGVGMKDWPAFSLLSLAPADLSDARSGSRPVSCPVVAGTKTMRGRRCA